MAAEPVLRPVEDRTLRAQVTRQILGMVTGGHYAPGEKLTESALAEQLQVSRAPLREALRELVDRGILVSQPYRGLHVRPVSAADLEELYSMRIALEQFAMRLVWPRRDAAMLADLDRRYRALFAMQETGQKADTIERELAFHAWVYEHARHALLLDHWQRLVPLVQIYMSLHFRTHGSHGEFRHMTTEYLEMAGGTSLDAMQDHIERHMRQGLTAVLAAL